MMGPRIPPGLVHRPGLVQKWIHVLTAQCVVGRTLEMDEASKVRIDVSENPPN